MAKSIPAQSNLFSLETCEGSASATSSPGLADGVTPSDLPAGLMTEPSGQVVVPASRSLRPGPALAPPIRAIFGRRGSSSSQSAALQSSLANRLRVRLALDGSIVFRMTWKVRTTPSGRRICALRASARSTSDSAYGSWRSPDHSRRGGAYRDPDKALRRVTSGHQINLEDQAVLASWPSPVVNDAKGSDYAYSQGNHDRPVLKLGGVAKLASWATQAARDFKSESASDEFNDKRFSHPRGKPLSAEATLASWPTPTALSPATSAYNEAGDSCNLRKTRLLVSGPMLSGSPAETGSTGQLNPAHSRWLMGYPPEWDACAVTAMPSSRRLPPNSSVPISSVEGCGARKG